MAYTVGESFAEIGASRLGLGGALSRLMDQPAIFTNMKTRLVSTGRKAAPVSLNAPEHANRIRFERIASTPSLDSHAEIAAMARELGEDHDWVMLGELLEEWDQARAACRINRRLIHTAIWEVLEGLHSHRQDPKNIAPVLRPRVTDETAAEVERAAQENPHLYTLSALAAQMRLSQAWDYRGEDLPQSVSAVGWRKIERAIAMAEASLNRCDAKALSSPFVAMVRFNFVPFQSDAQKRILDAYKDWICLDPGDLMPHVRIGTFMLPRWFGDLETLEKTALKAVAWTDHEIDATAYAAIYCSAMTQDDSPMLYMDPELFSEGIEDLISYRMRDPAHVPHTVQDLWRFSNRPPRLGASPEERQEWVSRTDMLGKLAKSCVMRHLTAIHPKSWRGGEKAALDHISASAQDELLDGDNLVVSKRGVTAVAAAAA